MISHPENTDAWAPCEPGCLQSLGERLRRRPSVSTAKTAGVAMAVCAAAVLAVGLAVNSVGGSEPEPAPIACHDVAAHLDDYACGACEAELRARIELHLSRCGKCAHHLKEIRTADAVPPTGRLALLASMWNASVDDGVRSN